jgi:hypothetical protein
VVASAITTSKRPPWVIKAMIPVFVAGKLGNNYPTLSMKHSVEINYVVRALTFATTVIESTYDSTGI